MDHGLRYREQTRNVDSGSGSRHQAEWREYRVAPADARLSMEDGAESVGLRSLLQWCAGIGDGDETSTGLVPANRVRDARKEIVFEHKWLGRDAGFARNDEQRPREVDRGFRRFDLRRVCRIEDPESGPAGFPFKRQ
jgi:hypothetical protein